MTPLAWERAPGPGYFHGLNVEFVDREVRTPCRRAGCDEMPGVGRISRGTLPSCCWPLLATGTGPEYSHDGPLVDHWPDAGIEDVQDRGCHRVSDALQAQESRLIDSSANRVPGGLAPVIPLRVARLSSDRPAVPWPDAVDGCPGAGRDFVFGVEVRVR